MLLRCTLVLSLAATPALAQAPPDPPQIRWAKSTNALVLRITPAEGTHLTADLPLEATIDDGGAFRVTWNEPEVPEHGPMKLLLPRVAGEASTGWTVAAQGGVCNVGGSICLPWHAAFEVPRRGRARGSIQAERGRAPRAPAAEEPKASPHTEGPWHEATDDAAVALAFAQAVETERPLLVDFFAQWCPPCDRLSDEFLHDPAREPLLDRFVLLRADADHPASFSLKDRYRVGGYPTVLLLAPDGSLIDRIVGYQGSEAFAARLEALEPVPDATLLEQLAQAAPGSEAEAALRTTLSRRAESAGDGARAWELLAAMSPIIDRLGGADLIWAAGLALDAEAKGATALALEVAERMPVRAAGLVSQVADGALAADREAEATALEDRWYAKLADEPWGAVEEFEEGVLGAVVGRDGAAHEALAEAGYYRSHWGTDPHTDFALAALHYAASMLLDANLAGEGESWTVSIEPLLVESYLAHNAGRVHELLGLLEGAMRYPDAERFYPPMVALHPEDFTWHFKLASHFVKRGGWAEALVSVERAVERSYGDNRLRAVKLQSEILLEMGRGDEALVALDQALQAPIPEATHVRTHRYRKQLETLRLRALSQAGPR